VTPAIIARVRANYEAQLRAEYGTDEHTRLVREYRALVAEAVGPSPAALRAVVKLARLNADRVLFNFACEVYQASKFQEAA